MIKMLEIKEAVFGYTGKQKKKVVIENISFALEPGKLMCFLGANGAGKLLCTGRYWALFLF